MNNYQVRHKKSRYYVNLITYVNFYIYIQIITSLIYRVAYPKLAQVCIHDRMCLEIFSHYVWLLDKFTEDFDKYNVSYDRISNKVTKTRYWFPKRKISFLQFFVLG